MESERPSRVKNFQPSGRPGTVLRHDRPASFTEAEIAEAALYAASADTFEDPDPDMVRTAWGEVQIREVPDA